MATMDERPFFKSVARADELCEQLALLAIEFDKWVFTEIPGRHLHEAMEQLKRKLSVAELFRAGHEEEVLEDDLRNFIADRVKAGKVST